MKSLSHDIALYRKYRPQTFADVIGQDHVVSVLQGAIKQKNISHAYLFSGSRGTGKTSIARIFAREIGTSGNDIYEIDAASNRGIDDVREIRESVNTLPFESPYKVYIIDEVHMLTKEAFNALLKTLEEPPAYVVFILATTEMHKLPETVISRCQTFSFKKPAQSVLKKVVADIATEEGFSIDASSADLIALLGDGSFRDTLGVLQKVISSIGGKKITSADVEAITGAPRTTLVNALVTAVARKDVAGALEVVQSAVAQNADIEVFTKMILEKMRLALLLRCSSAMEKTIQEQVSDTDFVWLKELSADTSAQITSGVLASMLTACERSSASLIPQLPLELAIVMSVSA